MPRLSRRAGTSLTEIMYASVIGSILLGSSTTLYLLISQRTQKDAARAMALSQAVMLADDMTDTIGKARSIAIGVSGPRQYVYFVLPGNASDANGDGIGDFFQPESVNLDGSLNYIAGQNVAYYWSDDGWVSVGGVVSQGRDLWRSQSALTGGSTGADIHWARHGNGTSKWNLIDDVRYVYDATNRIVTITITASAKNRNLSRGNSTQASEEHAAVTITRRVRLRHATF